ncbi:MAG TPA: type II toxin-antitoxin system RelE/ParE family toxin [Allosphingosinicella sp.]|nr:type II toxin-antitoxin system RelE/ParE family toxin [Allosphingosinicella sp.]
MRLKWRSEALDDLQRIFSFNAGKSESFAVQVERRLLQKAQALTTNPQLGRSTKRKGIMRLSVTDIQYVIDYRRFEDRVSIVRIRSSREIR